MIHRLIVLFLLSCLIGCKQELNRQEKVFTVTKVEDYIVTPIRFGSIPYKAGYIVTLSDNKTSISVYIKDCKTFNMNNLIGMEYTYRKILYDDGSIELSQTKYNKNMSIKDDLLVAACL